MSTTSDISVSIEAQLLNELVQPALVLTQDSNAVFRWHEDKLKIANVDGANTIKIHQSIDSTEFESYELRGGSYSIGVKCNRLSNILDSLSPTDTVSLSIDTETNEIAVEFDQGQYGMAGVDKSTIREPSKSDLAHSVTLHIHKSAINQAHDIIGMVSDRIEIDVTETEITFSGRGDTDRATIGLSTKTDDGDLAQDEVLYENPVSTPIVSKYDKRLIGDLKKFIPNSHIKVKLAENQPLEVLTKRADEKIDTQIVVAPKVTP
ncbi:hypothetical protein [Halorubrum tebenquichense]|uniref:hypothetical protein n=1 Tax=Halorubrum tebenquichense TaxID=119434 RepID=UPI0012688D4B|nr:hypothetical protein [Halorubrum tebenquichense]